MFGLTPSKKKTNNLFVVCCVCCILCQGIDEMLNVIKENNECINETLDVSLNLLFQNFANNSNIDLCVQSNVMVELSPVLAKWISQLNTLITQCEIANYFSAMTNNDRFMKFERLIWKVLDPCNMFENIKNIHFINVKPNSILTNNPAIFLGIILFSFLFFCLFFLAFGGFCSHSNGLGI